LSLENAKAHSPLGGDPPAAGSSPASPAALDEHSTAMVSENLAGTAPAADDPQPPSALSATPLKRVLDQPVDRLALADNLLRSLQLDLALQIYQQLDGELPAPEDQAWIRFQIANCHRLSGRLNEAKKVFRELTNSGREDFPVPLARWWLTAIDRQADLMARSQRFEEILQSFPGAPGHAQ
jgi:hypothetical protein